MSIGRLRLCVKRWLTTSYWACRASDQHQNVEMSLCVKPVTAGGCNNYSELKYQLQALLDEVGKQFNNWVTEVHLQTNFLWVEMGAEGWVSVIILSSDSIKYVSAILFGGRALTKTNFLKARCFSFWSPNLHHIFLEINILKALLVIPFGSNCPRFPKYTTP